MPVYSANALNGRPAVRFEGADEQHFVRPNSSGVPQVTTQGLTIYAVVRHINALAYSPFAPNRIILSQYNPGSATSQQYAFGVQDVFVPEGGLIYFRVRFDDGTEVSLSSTPNAFPYEEWVITTGRLRNGVLDARTNGTQVASTSASGTIRAPHTSTALHIGATVAGINTWPGDIAAVYLYNEGHDDDTVETVEEHLRVKYGLAVAP